MSCFDFKINIVHTMSKHVVICLPDSGNFSFPKTRTEKKKVGCLIRVNTIYDQSRKPGNVILINSLHFLHIPGHISAFQWKTMFSIVLKLLGDCRRVIFSKQKFSHENFNQNLNWIIVSFRYWQWLKNIPDINFTDSNLLFHSLK